MYTLAGIGGGFLIIMPWPRLVSAVAISTAFWAFDGLNSPDTELAMDTIRSYFSLTNVYIDSGKL